MKGDTILNIIKVSAHGVKLLFALGIMCVLKENTSEEDMSQISDCRANFAGWQWYAKDLVGTGFCFRDWIK